MAPAVDFSAGINSWSTPQQWVLRRVDSLSSGGNLSAGLNGPNGGSGSNYLTSRGTVCDNSRSCRQLEKLCSTARRFFHQWCRH